VTFNALTYVIDGGNQTSQLWRLALEAASMETPGGVIGPLDCIVNQTVVPSLGILISDGKFLIEGIEVADQGTYYGYNVGNDSTLTIAATTGTPRSDMIIARVEDPTFAGSPWGGSVGAQTIFPRVISNVSSSATTPPAGQSAIALARIDMPATASTVLQSYITDLRTVANPKRQRTILTAAGPGSPSNWTVGTSPTAWPAVASWQIAVPAWATGVKMRWDITSAVFLGGGNGFARGNIYPVFGASVGSPNVTFPSRLVSINFGGGAAEYEVMSISGAADVTIPAAVRNTTQTLQLAQTTDGTNTGIIEVTEGALVIMDVEFLQRAVTS